MNGSLWSCVLYTFVVALLCLTLYKLMSHSLPHTKPVLGLMNKLEFDPFAMFPRVVVSNQALPPATTLSPLVSTFPSLPMLYQEQCFKELLLSACLNGLTISSPRAGVMPVFFSFAFAIHTKLCAWHMKALNSYLVTLWLGLCSILTMH